MEMSLCSGLQVPVLLFLASLSSANRVSRRNRTQIRRKFWLLSVSCNISWACLYLFYFSHGMFVHPHAKPKSDHDFVIRLIQRTNYGLQAVSWAYCLFSNPAPSLTGTFPMVLLHCWLITVIVCIWWICFYFDFIHGDTDQAVIIRL